MSDTNYHQNLAAILEKSQGCIDKDTGRHIDVGGEVLSLRNECDRLRTELERLRERIDSAAEKEEQFACNSSHNGEIKKHREYARRFRTLLGERL